MLKFLSPQSGKQFIDPPMASESNMRFPWFKIFLPYHFNFTLINMSSLICT